jgi:hypothetical protein
VIGNARTAQELIRSPECAHGVLMEPRHPQHLPFLFDKRMVTGGRGANGVRGSGIGLGALTRDVIPPSRPAASRAPEYSSVLLTALRRVSRVLTPESCSIYLSRSWSCVAEKSPSR